MLLAYMVLIMKGRPMLEQDLDDACEVGWSRPSAAARAHYVAVLRPSSGYTAVLHARVWDHRPVCSRADR